MRQSSFEIQCERSATQLVGQKADPQSERSAHWGAVVVALVAFLALYRNAGLPNPVSIDSSWITVLSHAFAQGWQWGSDIVSGYGPLGFLTPYFGWEGETASTFRVGQIVLSVSSALLLYVFAKSRSAFLQVVVGVCLLAWYPLLVMDIGWAVPFVFAVVLIHDMLDAEWLGQPRRWLAALIVALLTVLAMTSYYAMLMWVVVVAYAALASAFCRDRKFLAIFGIGAPIAFIATWLSLGQSLPGLIDYVVAAGELRNGYAALSTPAPPHVDLLGIAAMFLLTTQLAIGCKLARTRQRFLLASAALFALSFLAWRSGFVRADQHVVIYFGIASFIAVAGLSLAPPRIGPLTGVTRALAGLIIVIGLAVSYGKFGVSWSLDGIRHAVAGLVQPALVFGEGKSAAAELEGGKQLQRTQARIGSSAVDVLMNDPSIALVNKLNYRPRPTYLGYSAYTPVLARLNEAHLLTTDAPKFLLAKFQTIDNRLPTVDDPLSVLAALRAYRPVDMEGGYLVMQRIPGSIEPLPVPDADNWKVTSFGADLDINQETTPQALFFDIRLNFWGRLRSALLREPGISMHVKLSDGTEQRYSLVRRLGLAGMLVSPFMLTEADYLRWHAGLSERRVMSLQLRATDPSSVRWFDPVFPYAVTPVEVPRSSVANLSPELKQLLYPDFSPAPTSVETSHQEVMKEYGADVLFVHAPASLTFNPEPGLWSVTGKFGLISTAYNCQASDGVALIAERVSSDGQVTNLLARAIDPVHRSEDRGPQDFEVLSFSVGRGDRVLIRSAPGLSESSASDCDWSYFSSIKFANAPDR